MCCVTLGVCCVAPSKDRAVMAPCTWQKHVKYSRSNHRPSQPQLLTSWWHGVTSYTLTCKGHKFCSKKSISCTVHNECMWQSLGILIFSCSFLNALKTYFQNRLLAIRNEVCINTHKSLKQFCLFDITDFCIWFCPYFSHWFEKKQDSRTFVHKI